VRKADKVLNIYSPSHSIHLDRYKTNTEIAKELNITAILGKITEEIGYKSIECLMRDCPG
jgi:hypothetical protein